MTPEEHYLEAERLILEADQLRLEGEEPRYTLITAQIHATLATAHYQIRTTSKTGQSALDDLQDQLQNQPHRPRRVNAFARAAEQLRGTPPPNPDQTDA